MKTPWDKPRSRKKRLSVSQEIKDTREWLMVTYGGRWGKLKTAADNAAKLEKRIMKLKLKVRDLEAERRARIN